MKKKLKYAPYSFSKISVFEQCPRKFKYQYIDKLPVPRKPQIHNDRGKLFHLLLEHDGDLKKVKETKDWKEIISHNLLSKENIKEVFSIYKNFISSKEGQSILKHKALLKEFPLGLNENLEIVKYDDKDVVLRGFIDACYILEDRSDVCLVIDWKSGKKKTKEQQSWAQLLWYSLGLFSQNPELEKIILVFAYVEHNHLNTKVVYRKDIEKYKKALHDKIQKIETEKDFPKEESPLCSYCDFEEFCRTDM
jgi:CRISPR/Cas system-associated exonuclease Cas4 (RecB family)